MNGSIKELPVIKHLPQIRDAIRHNQVTIVVGKTGCGKTRGVDGLLLEEDYKEYGMIGLVEPRRISVTGIAPYLASLVPCELGDQVGYAIRFNKIFTEWTYLKVMTDGVLLQEKIPDVSLSHYVVLVFDEAHERGENSDMLLNTTKLLLKQRPDLRVVVMSATIDAKKFSTFFDNAPIIEIIGEMYPVEIRYLQPGDREKALKYFQNPRFEGDRNSAITAYWVAEIYDTWSPQKDILVFLPGKYEIYRTKEYLEELCPDMNVVVVHGELTPEEQNLIYADLPNKVVLATPIAQSSITVEHIGYIVSLGLVNRVTFNPVYGVTHFDMEEASEADLDQQAGRGGRLETAVCLRLFLSSELRKGRKDYILNHREREKYTRPALESVDLTDSVLKLLGYGIKDIEHFDMLDSPPQEFLSYGLHYLEEIGAITHNRDLTPNIGWRLHCLPIATRLGNLILNSVYEDCVFEATTIAAFESVKEVFLRPFHQMDEADASKFALSDFRSDYFTFLHVMQLYEAHDMSHDWADAHFLNWHALDEAYHIREELLSMLPELGIAVTSVGYEHINQAPHRAWHTVQYDAIGRAVMKSFIRDLAVLDDKTGCYYHRSGLVSLHKRSILSLHEPKPRLVVSNGVIQMRGTTYISNAHPVELEWVEALAPDLVSRVKVTQKGKKAERVDRVSVRVMHHWVKTEDI